MASGTAPITPMGGSTVTLRGDTELMRKFKEMSEAVQSQALADAAMVGAEVVKAEAKAICPVSKSYPGHTGGRLRSSIMSELDSATATRAVVNIGYGMQAPYGKYVELGTYKMAAQPFLRPALATKQKLAGQVMADTVWRILTFYAGRQ